MALASVAVVIAIVAGLLLSPGSGGGTRAVGDVLPLAAGVATGIPPAPGAASATATKNPVQSPPDAPSTRSPSARPAAGMDPAGPGFGGDEPPVIVTVPDLPPGAIEPLATLSFDPPGTVAATTPTTAGAAPAGAPTTPGPVTPGSVPPGTTAHRSPTVRPVPSTRPNAAPAPAAPAVSTASPPKTAPAVPAAPTRVITVPAHYAHPLGWLGGGKVVSLTFDDGPSQYTGRVLDVLAGYGVKATFCQIGEQVGDFPAVEKRIAAQGHTLCNHTWNHDEALPSRTVPVIDSEITRTQQAILALTGTTPRYYRAPGGNWGRTGVLKAELARYRTIPLAWADDSLDWTTPGVAAIVKNVVGTVTPGAIILMHDGGGNRSQTLAALPKIIVALRAAGYTFVALPREPPLG